LRIKPVFRQQRVTWFLPFYRQRSGFNL
jgi:hypothetical protein